MAIEACACAFRFVMKKLIIILLSFFLACGAYAQDSKGSVLKKTPFKNTFNMANVEDAIGDLRSMWKADANGVTFALTVDSLPLSASEILAYAKEYLEEAYRPSKYEVETVNTEKAFVIGEGEFVNFETYAAFPNNYSFDCPHHVRIDAKEGRARISVVITEYEVLRNNGNIAERTNVKIKDVSPVNPDSDSSHKMYNKVFLAMAKLIMETMYDFQDEIRSKMSSETEDW